MKRVVIMVPDEYVSDSYIIIPITEDPVPRSGVCAKTADKDKDKEKLMEKANRCLVNLVAYLYHL